MGCFCTSRLIAAPTHTAPKMKNRDKMHDYHFPGTDGPPGQISERLPYFSATTKAVTRMFAIASGNRNFQPKAINWS